MKHGPRKGRFTKANASRLGKLGAAVREEKRLARLAEGWTDSTPLRVPEGAPLGQLTWQAADGTVRRWIIRQGPRANNILVIGRTPRHDPKPIASGWDKFFRTLRRHLSTPKRLFTP
jgi:hypothetical protein